MQNLGYFSNINHVSTNYTHQNTPAKLPTMFASIIKLQISH